MNDKSLHLALPVVSLMVMMAPVLVAQEQNSTPSASEQRAMTILKNMSEYLANGVFYEEAGQGYKIVQPPVGVLVPSIPEGAATVTVNGAKYFEFGGIWYRPFYNGSDVVYQTVPNPTG